MFQAQKSNIVSLLGDFCDVECSQPQTEGMLIDGSAFVYSHPPQNGTFAEYSEITFAGKIAQLSQNHRRVAVVFDQYKQDSLKAHTRKSRGTGKRCKVTLPGKVPNNWKTFMRNDSNKSELFSILAKGICTIDDSIVYSTYDKTSVCNKIARQSISCTHEEADTRLLKFMHLKHAIEIYCITSACILSNDTDILVLALAFLKN